MSDKLKKTDAEWRETLTPDQYRIMRQSGTEPPFTGEHLGNKDNGTYTCLGCGQALFASRTKFDSGSGWPSFWAPVAEESIDTHVDRTHGMIRSELKCSRCESHLGHVFEDGPDPTGLRYCINSAALKFEPVGK